MLKITDIFDVFHGANLELNALKQDPYGINFVSRTAKNNGVSAKVKKLDYLEPFPAGVITIAASGSVMESFLQPEPFYSGFHIFYLVPKIKMSNQQKLYYCTCLRANKYRFNYGRQANRSLKNILIPALNELPEWNNKINVDCFHDVNKTVITKSLQLNFCSWKIFKYEQLFSIERGRGPRKKELNGNGKNPFVSASEFNNGITDYSDKKPFHKSNVITVVRNGNSVAKAFYQNLPFHSTEDVHIFTPKFIMNIYIALFLCTLIKRERYRYNYGRKWSITRMNKTEIKLPVNIDGTLNFSFMEQYIKSLPYSSSI